MLTIQLLISFLVGGILISLQTLLAERVHGYMRGVILTVPTTLALGLLFIGILKSSADAVEAAIIVPAGLGLNYLFIAIFASLIRFGLFAALTGSILTFSAGAYALINFPPAGFLSSTFLYGAPLTLAGYLIVRARSKEQKLKQYPMNARHIIGRSLIGGAVIALIVFFSKTLGNTWGGMFSVFPAAFTSTLIIYYILQGAGAIPAVARSLFFPGYFGFVLYAAVSAATFPLLGAWLGTLAAYCATFVFFYLCSFISKKEPAPETQAQV